MQPINCKISFKQGDSKIYSTLLKTEYYKISTKYDEDSFCSAIFTQNELRDFCIQYYFQVDEIYDSFVAQGFHTNLPSVKIDKTTHPNKLSQLISKNILSGTGYEFSAEYDRCYDKNVSFGLCLLRSSCSSQTLLICSLNESDTFTKFEFDTAHKTLKITRDFTGYSVNTHRELLSLAFYEGEYNDAISHIKGSLNCSDDCDKNYVIFDTFTEFGCNINEKLLINKIHTLQNDYNVFMIGDGYSRKGADILDVDNRLFPSGFSTIVDKIHEMQKLAAIWIAPFAVSPQSPNFSNVQDLIVKQGEKSPVTSPYWGGAHSLDITKDGSREHVKSLIDAAIDFGFDIIFCDCIYLAGCIPHDGKTQAMLIRDAISQIQKFAQGKQLILGGVPFLSAVSNCDLICLSPASTRHWRSPQSVLSPVLPSGGKASLTSLTNKKVLDDLAPCIATLPNCAKIKRTLASSLKNCYKNIVLPQRFVTSK